MGGDESGEPEGLKAPVRRLLEPLQEPFHIIFTEQAFRLDVSQVHSLTKDLLMTTIKTRAGTELFVKDWGEGRPVVLLHGWPLTSDTWDDFAYAAANNGFRAISYDRRGFGRSDQPWTGYDYDTLADDLADVMEAKGLDDAALFGFSMGGG